MYLYATMTFELLDHFYKMLVRRFWLGNCTTF